MPKLTIRGVEIPDWMARNNSVERLTAIIQRQQEMKEIEENFDPEEHQDPGSWGLYVIHPNGHPQIFAMGQTQDKIEELAEMISLEKPDIHIEIFEHWTWEN